MLIHKLQVELVNTLKSAKVQNYLQRKVHTLKSLDKNYFSMINQKKIITKLITK